MGSSTGLADCELARRIQSRAATGIGAGSVLPLIGPPRPRGDCVLISSELDVPIDVPISNGALPELG